MEDGYELERPPGIPGFLKTRGDSGWATERTHAILNRMQLYFRPITRSASHEMSSLIAYPIGADFEQRIGIVMRSAMELTPHI